MRSLIAAALQIPAWRDMAPLLNDAAYLDLLLKQPVDARSLRERLRTSPKDPAIISTLALERLCAGQKSEAIALFDGAGLHDALLAPNQRVVLACVLAANGRSEDAVVVAARIPAAKISKQELELLKQYLAP
jgi:hypothetical protein